MMINVGFIAIILSLLINLFVIYKFSLLKSIYQEKNVLFIINTVIEEYKVELPIIDELSKKNGLKIFGSYYDVNKQKIVSSSGVKKAKDTLTIFIMLHEIAHYIQHVTNNEIYTSFRKFRYNRVLFIICFISEFYLLFNLLNMDKVNIFGSLIITSIIFVFSLVIETTVMLKIERSANLDALKWLNSNGNSIPAKLENSVRLLFVKDISNIVIIAVLYILLSGIIISRTLI